MSIATKLTSILEYKGDIKDAIERKGVTVGDIPLSEYSYRIDEIECPNEEEAPWNDIRFVDFDGTCILSYSKAEFLQLETMPTNPKTHQYLTNDGWNWSFENAKTYVQKYGYCLIGAIYKSSDDATRICIDLPEDLLEVPLNIRQSKSEGTLIDWGDGTSERFVSTNTGKTYDVYHTYAEPGEYIITITPDSDCTILLEENGYGGFFGYYYANTRQCFYNCIKWYIIGRVNYASTYLGTPGLNCEWRSIPNGGIAHSSNIYGSYKMKAIIFPQSFTNYNWTMQIYPNCKELSLPDTASGSIGQSFFAGSYNLNEIIIPEGITEIKTYAFQATHAKIIIIPDSVIMTTATNSQFQQCRFVEYIHFPNNNETTSFYTATFTGCNSLKSIVLPNSITTLGNNAFSDCFSVEEIVLNEGLVTIGSTVFFGCSKLTEITIPSTVTSIGNNAFNFQPANLYGIERLYMKPMTPPTLGSLVVNVFKFATDYTIYIPTGSLSAYEADSVWSTCTGHFEEYNFN